MRSASPMRSCVVADEGWGHPAVVLASTINPLSYASDDRDLMVFQRHFPEEPAALRRTISRAMTDESFLRTLMEDISVRHELLRRQRECVSEVVAIVEQG